MRQISDFGLGALAASLFSFACAGGTDTGNPYIPPQGTSEPVRCDQTERTLEPGETTSLGTSANELYGWLRGEHRESLEWKDAASSFDPENGHSEITIEVEPLGARFIDQRPGPYKPYGKKEEITPPDIAPYNYSCGDWIELDVRLHVSTQDGALDETLETTLETRAPDIVSGRLKLQVDTLNGSFQPEVPMLQGRVPRGRPYLSLSFSLSRYGSAGGLFLGTNIVNSDGTVEEISTLGQVARFPAGDDCGSGNVRLSADEALRGVSMAGVLERLNASSPAPLDGSSATLELEFASSTESVCVYLNQDGSIWPSGKVRFPGTVRLRSSDQRIDGTFPIMLTGEASAGVLERSAAGGGGSYPLSAAEATAATRRYAIVEPLDFSGHAGGFFMFTNEVTDTGTVGALRAYGLDAVDCLENPPPNEENANGPGCTDTDRVEIWGVSWSK